MTDQIVIDRVLKIFDVFRGKFDPSEDYYVLLFLLSAYKDDLIPFEFISENEDSFKTKFAEIFQSKNKTAIQYRSISKLFVPALEKLSNHGLKEVVKILYTLDRKRLVENFPEIFDNVLYRIARSIGRAGGEYVQPLELTRFICDLTDLKSDATVFNPFAGLASFGVYLHPDAKYFGQEINQTTWALGVLRLLAYGRITTSEYECKDSILHWPSASTKYDLILANPPLIKRLEPEYNKFYPVFRTIEQFLIEKGLQSLNQSGRLIAVLPQGVLFRSYEQDSRRKLVDEDLIESIISFPAGLLYNTGIPFIILVLDKAKKNPEHVCFIDAKRFVVSKTPKEKLLEFSELLKVVKGTEQNLDVVRIVNIEMIKAFDYNLNVPRYFQKEVEGTKLKEILEFMEGHRINLPKKVKMIRISDLKDDKVDFNLDISKLEISEPQMPNIHLIEGSSLLLATRWQSLKPTYFRNQGEPIFRNQDVLAFQVDESKVDIEYLVNELHAGYVQEQIESLRIGETIPFIRKEDLLEIKIKLPSISEQQAKIMGIKEEVLANKVQEVKLEAQKLGLYKQHFHELSTLKHAFGKPLLNLNTAISNLKIVISRYEKENNVISLLSRINEKFDYTISDQFELMEKNLLYVSELLEKSDNDLFLEKFKLEPIDICHFLKEYMEELRTNHADRFSIWTDTVEGDYGIYDVGLVFIKANITLLKILFDNIIDNALRHAFTEKSEKYWFNFYLGTSQRNELPFVEIEIVNNGNPFPENFDQEKFISKNMKAGATGNTGLGGYQINQITTFLGGEYVLDVDNSSHPEVMHTMFFPVAELKPKFDNGEV